MPDVFVEASRLWARLSRTRAVQRVFALAVAMVFLCGALSVAPAGQQSFPSPYGRRPRSPFEGLDPITVERQMRALNAERQKSMVSDADKLLKLARELNAEVAARGTNSLTPEELRKVDEIEKLARNVKQKMVRTVGGGPAAPDLFSPMVREQRY